MMDVTFNGTAPVRLRTSGNKIQMTLTTRNGGLIETTMDKDEAFALSDVLDRMAEELQS